MTTSPEPTQVPLLLAQLCYFEVPRNAWPRTLLRARQLGAHGVATAVRWSWHAPTSELIDLDGTSDPQRDLIGFVEACARLNLALLLDFGSVTDDTIPRADLPAWLAATPLSEHERGVNAPRPSAERSEAARHWIAACSRSLVAYQAPDGPIVALRHAGDLQLAGWLRDNGWAVPIAQADPNYGDQLSDSAAGWLGDFAGAAILPGAARPTLEPANRAAEPLLRPDGSARPR